MRCQLAGQVSYEGCICCHSWLQLTAAVATQIPECVVSMARKTDAFLTAASVLCCRAGQYPAGLLCQLAIQHACTATTSCS